MSKYYDISRSNHPGKDPHHRKNPWITALKVCCWVVGSLVVLAAVAFWIISYHLSPSYITKLIEEKCDEYLEAEVKIGSIDYKLWSSYPWLYFEVDSLSVISKSLDGISREEQSQLPVNSDFLASVEKMHGKINIHSLIHKKINLKDIEIERPSVNIVIVNDTTANFNILKSGMPKGLKVPEIRLSEIKVTAPVDFSFFSLPQELSTKLDIEEFYLASMEENYYKIGFEGKADARYKDYTLPEELPIKFTMGLKGPYFSTVVLDDLSLGIAGITMEAEGTLDINRKGYVLKDASFNFKIEDLFSLLHYVPQSLSHYFTLPEGLTGLLPLNIEIALMAPYKIPETMPQKINLQDMPELQARVLVENAQLSFSPRGEKPLEADDIFIDLYCQLHPSDPELTLIDLKELRIKGEGINLWGEAEFTNLTEEQQEFNGKFNFTSPIVKTLAYFLPNSPYKISGFLKGDVEFSGNTLNLGKEGIKDLYVSGQIASHSFKLKAGGNENVEFKNFKTDFQTTLPALPLNNNYSGTKFGIDFTADTLFAISGNSKVRLADIELKIDALDTIPGAPDPSGDILFKVKSLQLNSGGNLLEAKNLELNAGGALSSSPQSSQSALQAASVPTPPFTHTPLQLVYNGNGGILQTVIPILKLDADIKLDRGTFQGPDYLYPVNFSGLNISTNLNDVNLSAKEVTVANTGMALNVGIKGIVPFITTYSPTMLKIDGDIDFTNVDINQLSWGYYGALIKQGKDSVYYTRPIFPMTASDSVCVVIPNNIDANLRIKSKAAQYMQYNFSPLSTNIIVKDGAATLSKLTIGAPYCTAVVDWTYSTTYLYDIFMNLKAQVKDFKFSPFYEVFPQLTLKTPELKNFTGDINADINCNFLMYPNMFMNSQSLEGKFDIKGSHLQFAREGKIQRITHLLLVEGDEPIHIDNFNITGTYHDNLLQLNPFKIGFDEYEVEFAGINNTSGDMYYHIALLKSPFHLPFGVSLLGNFKHPEIRLGGTHINDYKAELVSNHPVKPLNVNIMAYLRHGWALFIQQAAKYEENLKKNESK